MLTSELIKYLGELYLKHGDVRIVDERSGDQIQKPRFKNGCIYMQRGTDLKDGIKALWGQTYHDHFEQFIREYKNPTAPCVDDKDA